MQSPLYQHVHYCSQSHLWFMQGFAHEGVILQKISYGLPMSLVRLECCIRPSIHFLLLILLKVTGRGGPSQHHQAKAGYNLDKLPVHCTADI